MLVVMGVATLGLWMAALPGCGSGAPGPGTIIDQQDAAAVGDAPVGPQQDAPSCTDGIHNGQETDIDCGGPDCQQCDNGFSCINDSDCVSGHCGYQECVPPQCVNGAQDGDETDVDCGGTECGPCPDGYNCDQASDCQSGVCDETCQVATCEDEVENGEETGVDCGGGSCLPCENGVGCQVPDDCVSHNCVGGVCAVCVNETTFSWEAPNQNTDGSCVTDLGGYRLYYGPETGYYTAVYLIDLTSTACVDSGTSNVCGAIMTCTHVVPNLPAGLWYFAMTAYDLEGNESDYSNEVSKEILCE